MGILARGFRDTETEGDALKRYLKDRLSNNNNKNNRDKAKCTQMSPLPRSMLFNCRGGEKEEAKETKK